MVFRETRSGTHLVAECEGHGGDQHAKEQLQFAQSVLVQQQERERVDDGDQSAAPEGDSAIENKI